MELAHFLAFNAALLAAMASPGPALILLIQTTLAGGRGAGIATGAGLAVMAAGWTLAALLGLEVLFRAFPLAFTLFKLAGAAYLIWIAVSTWRGANRPVTAGDVPKGRAFRRGFLVNLGNPKSVLFAAAVLVVVFPAGLGTGEIALITLNHLVVEVLVYAGFAATLSTDAVSRRYLAAKPVLDRGAALVLGALGLRLLIQRAPA